MNMNINIPRKRTGRHPCVHRLGDGNDPNLLPTNAVSWSLHVKRKPVLVGQRNSKRAKLFLMVVFAFYVGACLLFAPSALLQSTITVSTHTVTAGDNAVVVDRRLSTTISEDDYFSSNDVMENDEEYFSACILWMDDNHRLEEWLAYHYYFLKLRYVVINVDPKSTTSPKAIIDRWNGRSKIYNKDSEQVLDYNLNMTIVLWNDTMYTDPTKYEFEQSKIAIARGDKKYKAATEYHKLRQPAFYKACTKHLISERDKKYQQKQQRHNHNSTTRTSTTIVKEHGKPSQWTAYFDTDEFFAFQPNSIRGNNNNNNNNNKYETPGYVLQKLNFLKKQKLRLEEMKKDVDLIKIQQVREERMEKDIENQLKMELSRNSLSKEERSGKNLILQQLRMRTTKRDPELREAQSSPGLSCLVIPRKGVASIELTELETEELLNRAGVSEALVPPGFVKEKMQLEETNTLGAPTALDEKKILRRFDTLRYKHHSKGMSAYGKSILDLSQSNVQEFVKGSFSFETHGVIGPICNKKGSNMKVAGNDQTENYSLVHKEKMQLNHYVGSWESYNARPNDARKGLSDSDSSAKFTENAKSYENWLKVSQNLSGEESTMVRPWLKGFIRLVGGPKVAAHLLQDAGILVFSQQQQDQDNEENVEKNNVEAGDEARTGEIHEAASSN